MSSPTDSDLDGMAQQIAARLIAMQQGQIEPDIALEAIAELMQVETRIDVLASMKDYLDERARKAGLVAPCVCPHCTKGEDGKPAIVDRRERSSGACCKEHMNFVCTHPDCIEKAKSRGWVKYTHPYGTAIAQKHYEYRKE